MGEVAGVTHIADAAQQREARRRGRPRGDGWDLTDTGYSLDRFYTATKIGDTEAEKIQLKLPSTVWARVCALVSDNSFPQYRTPHDAIRDAITHRLHYLVSEGYTLDEDVRDWIQLQVRQGEVERRQAMMRAARETVTKIGEALGEAEREKDWELFNELLEQAGDALGELRDPYKSDLRGLIEEYERRKPSKNERNGRNDTVRGKGSSR